MLMRFLFFFVCLLADFLSGNANERGEPKMRTEIGELARQGMLGGGPPPGGGNREGVTYQYLYFKIVR